MTTDLRHATRYPIVASVEVRQVQTNIVVRARTSDLSVTGCYIDTLNPLPAATDVELRITYRSAVATIRGTVVFCRSNMGMGVKFTSLNDHQVKTLQSWCDEIGVMPS